MTKPNVGPPAEAGADLAKGGCPGDADLLVRWDAARAAWRAWDVDDYEEKGWGLGADAARVMSSAGGALAKRLRAAQSARGVSSETIERIAIELAGRYCCSCPEDWDELTHTETCGAPIALAEIKQYLRHALAHPVPAAPGPTVADVAEVYGLAARPASRSAEAGALAQMADWQADVLAKHYSGQLVPFTVAELRAIAALLRTVASPDGESVKKNEPDCCPEWADPLGRMGQQFRFCPWCGADRRAGEPGAPAGDLRALVLEYRRLREIAVSDDRTNPIAKEAQWQACEYARWEMFWAAAPAGEGEKTP